MSFAEANRLGSKGEPFLIIYDYKKDNVITIPLDKLDSHDIEFEIKDFFNIKNNEKNNRDLNFYKIPVSFDNYLKKFNKVIDSIKLGYTYLLNLTQESEIIVNSNLKDIYDHAEAKYKLRYKNEFICYSPETFITIENNIISTYPMKGTLPVTSSNIINNGEELRENIKESAEHVMIVDLLRNDLNMVAKNIKVTKFKYVEKIKSGKGELWQMSSEIVGNLESGWQSRIGDILEKISPAGSITGTPKKRTVQLIKDIEDYDRGFFTGIFGVFNDNKFKSGVMIRFLEARNGKLFYKSGGGVTLDSDSNSEYNEMIDKIYLF